MNAKLKLDFLCECPLIFVLTIMLHKGQFSFLLPPSDLDSNAGTVNRDPLSV